MRTVATLLACVFAVSTAIFAQQKPQPSSPEEKTTTVPVSNAPDEGRRLVPLTVQIVLSRFKADKKIGSLPYTLSMAANDRSAKSLRMGIDVPIASKTHGYTYRSVGTNIDCIAESAPRDTFKLNITVEDSSIHLDTSKPTEPKPAMVTDVPVFRTFKSNFVLLLRDGQSGQFISAIDPISGEVMKVDVTVNVQK